jgi:hypothetical protein
MMMTSFCSLFKLRRLSFYGGAIFGNARARATE